MFPGCAAAAVRGARRLASRTCTLGGTSSAARAFSSSSSSSSPASSSLFSRRAAAGAAAAVGTAGALLMWSELLTTGATVSNAIEDRRRWPNTTVLESPAITMLFTSIRDKDAPVARYINDADRLMRILAEEGLARVAGVKKVTVQTPCGVYEGLQPVPEAEMCAVSIVRSGDILLEAVRGAAPNIKVGKILCQRDEHHPDKIAKLYYSKFPQDIATLRTVILVDPMLATGGSAILAIKTLLDAGVKEERIMFLNVVSCPEGLDALAVAFPKIQIVTAAVDSHLNEHKYIVPGLGDFGDRYYST
jgi:uracil phosphoribosyltransferase